MSDGTGSARRRFCRTCGTEANAGSFFCVSCGASLSNQPIQQDAPVSYLFPPQHEQTENKTNAKAKTALVLAILFWPLGIIYGHIARREIRRTGERGEGLSLAALIIGYAWGAVLLILVIAGLASLRQGFNSLTALQTSVSQQVKVNLDNPSNSAYSPNTSVTSTLCVHSNGTQYFCIVSLSDGSRLTLSVTVASDGSRWVTN